MAEYFLNDTAPLSLGLAFEPSAEPWSAMYWGVPAIFFEGPTEQFPIHALTLPMVPCNRQL